MGEREREACKRIKIVYFANTRTTVSLSDGFAYDHPREIKAEKAVVIITRWVRTQKRSPKYQPARSADEGILMSAGFLPSSA